MVICLNVVRPGRPEQWNGSGDAVKMELQSQCSPAWKTGTISAKALGGLFTSPSQCSPAWKTGTMLTVKVKFKEPGDVSM